jgi:hypothetical protein
LHVARLEQVLLRRAQHLQAHHGITLRFPKIQHDRAAILRSEHQRATKSGLPLVDGVEFCELLLAARGQVGLIICEFAYHRGSLNGEYLRRKRFPRST